MLAHVAIVFTPYLANMSMFSGISSEGAWCLSQQNLLTKYNNRHKNNKVISILLNIASITNKGLKLSKMCLSSMGMRVPS